MTRFNNRTQDYPLTDSTAFFVAPIRDVGAPTEYGVNAVICEIGDAEAYGVFRMVDDSESLLTHVTGIVLDAVRILAQIHAETARPVYWFDPHHGAIPARNHARGMTSVAECLTDTINGEIDSLDADEAAFDNHPLAPAREAFVDYSNYSGVGTALNPYEPVEDLGDAA